MSIRQTAKVEHWMLRVFNWCIIILLFLSSAHSGAGQSKAPCRDGQIVRKVISSPGAGPNLLRTDAWRPWQTGFERSGGVFVCDNSADQQVQRGASQTVALNQTKPEPIVASAMSRAADVGGGRNNDYALYLDLVYADGTPLWGQTAPFDVGTHDWQRRQVIVFPDKPVQTVSFHLLLRRHSGKAYFKAPELKVLTQPQGACLFDGVPVSTVGASTSRFEVRDVAGDSDFVAIQKQTLGLKITCSRTQHGGATFFDVTISDTTGVDRAITLYYVLPVKGDDLKWLHNPRTSMSIDRRREFVNASAFRVGANGRLSRYPFAAVADDKQGVALGIDMAYPAFYRTGFNASTKELFLAYDIGLAPEKPVAKLRFCTFQFDPKWQFRSALAKYYELFGNDFKSRLKRQGLWMPFAKISEVKGWRDFGFAFKEGANETKWDDAHDIITFRYTEPMTWWMRMDKDTPRTLQAAIAYAEQMAAKGNSGAKAWLWSSYHDENGLPAARILDTPWCDGAVWSMNSMPGIAGEFTDFKKKWNPAIRDKLYGPNRAADLDGEYIDSSEGYVTDELDFRRDHFAATRTPLTFSLGENKVGIFRGLIVFEYIGAIADDIHGMGRFMMANSTPSRLCWLAPMLDVMGTETDWNPGGKWRPMSDDQLLYRRAICGPKPFCFLMNTEFENFSHQLVEKYMKRSLAYGMYPGFFSHNASQGHYFTRPELYQRDRDLFKKYVPVCKLVGEAGWQPITKATSSDPHVYLERFGDNYLTVFNDSSKKRTITIAFEQSAPRLCREILTGKTLRCKDGLLMLTIQAEDVMVLDFQ